MHPRWKPRMLRRIARQNCSDVIDCIIGINKFGFDGVRAYNNALNTKQQKPSSLSHHNRATRVLTGPPRKHLSDFILLAARFWVASKA
jgi:hypothetical protein